MPFFFIQVTTEDGRIEFGRLGSIAMGLQRSNQMSKCLLVKPHMEVFLACPGKMFPVSPHFSVTLVCLASPPTPLHHSTAVQSYIESCK
jgi:hypothetical protein